MMIRSAVTVSLVPEARGGPFVYWDDIEHAARSAQELGFDAIEIFAPDADTLASDRVARALTENGLALAAVGTGAGLVKHKLTLTSADASVRREAVEFVKSIMDAGAAFKAPAIIGSMQGRWSEDRDVESHYLKDALEELGAYAEALDQPLLFEPLNRYETNLINTIGAGLYLLSQLSTRHVKLLADLFHMNIEESNVADALKRGGTSIGHVHFVDSNRRAAGSGHIDFAAVSKALRAIGYEGFLSAESLPLPDSQEAAATTIATFRKWFRT
jgi:sugar phosphate isomerase/epimerase